MNDEVQQARIEQALIYGEPWMLPRLDEHKHDWALRVGPCFTDAELMFTILQMHIPDILQRMWDLTREDERLPYIAALENYAIEHRNLMSRIK